MIGTKALKGRLRGVEAQASAWQRREVVQRAYLTTEAFFMLPMLPSYVVCSNAGRREYEEFDVDDVSVLYELISFSGASICAPRLSAPYYKYLDTDGDWYVLRRLKAQRGDKCAFAQVYRPVIRVKAKRQRPAG